MGRYYYDQDGREGKFWFAVQPSDDPGTVFHLNEEEGDESTIDYEGCDSEFIKKKLDEQYDILGVPKRERKYRIRDEKKFVWEKLEKYFLVDKRQNPNDIPYHMGDNEPRKYPKSDACVLAASRIELGLFILEAIHLHGHCFLTAEL